LTKLFWTVALTPLLLAATPAPTLKSTPDLGKAEGQCRPNEPGPALIVNAIGIKDRQGMLRAEVYPDNDDDFLADDNVLISEGKTFRRVEVPVPASGEAQICIRVPKAGRYTLSLLHDRDGNRKFSVWSDGIGFPGNPKLTRAKPKADGALVTAGPGLTPVNVTMNYLHGVFTFGPLKQK
jgi:uncharacterized protein (DUF2141 family)